ncbi:MAG: hypothetical protein U5R31_10060 [Acidimicrobiia bacterium]|nr:hypothetical protein [Acidimicrobiia bacterium]
MAMAAATAVAIGNGALRGALVLLILTGVPDMSSRRRWSPAKASGGGSPRGSFFDSVADRVPATPSCSAGVGGSPRRRNGQLAVAALRRPRGDDAHLLRAGQGRTHWASTPAAGSWSVASGSWSWDSGSCSTPCWSRSWGSCSSSPSSTAGPALREGLAAGRRPPTWDLLGRLGGARAHPPPHRPSERAHLAGPASWPSADR